MPACKKEFTPQQIQQGMNAVLEGEFWLPSIVPDNFYTRRQDDTDGQSGPQQELQVTFSRDGDAWVLLGDMQTLRFRSYFGGGQSLRVRNALMVLAEAIRRDNEESPQT